MKTMVRISTFSLIGLLCALACLSQPAPATAENWVRLGSDNGEFSIEIPNKEAKYFYYKEGFEVSRDRSTYSLKEMNLINVYSEGTLFSIETYQATKGAIQALAELEQRDVKLAKVENKGIEAKEFVKKTDDYFFQKRYFLAKKYIYVISAASRGNKGPLVDRFFESIYFKPGIADGGPPSVRFSTLTPSKLDIKTKDVQPSPVLGAPAQPIVKDPGRLLIATKPRPSYTDSARMGNVQGVIIVRVKFGSDGFIPTIEVIKGLPNGLFAQVLFAVLRMKFLPEEKSGKPVDVTKMIEYSFAIY